MKLILLSLLFSLGAQAQTMDARRAKEEMLQRTHAMRVASDEGQELFRNIQLEEACKQVDIIFRVMPNHLSSIMSRMNIFDRKIQKLKAESLELLKEVHRLSNKCEMGEIEVSIDPDKARKFLKDFSKKIKKHEREIKRSSTDFNNTYYYQYEF